MGLTGIFIYIALVINGQIPDLGVDLSCDSVSDSHLLEFSFTRNVP